MPMHEYHVPLATTRGRTAHLMGIPVEACPYVLGSVSALQWLSAWVHEDQDDEEAVVALVHQRGRVG